MTLLAGSDDPTGIQVGLSGILLTALASVAVAIIGAVAVIYASRQSRDAQKRTAEVDTRRVRLEEEREKREADAERHDRLKEYTDRIEADLGRARAEVADLRVENDRRSDSQARRCAAALSSAMDTVHVLQQVVRDEIASASADAAIDTALEHTRTEHPARPPDAEEYP
jgi:Skp family chaperone for outer membrane proteins